MARKVTDVEVDPPLVTGGVMKLGKALATGVAVERPQIHEDELELPERAAEFTEEKAPEEVPAAR
ncbi:hypothetical protein AB0M61_35760 [Streptomyces sp. NPDC051642]|uniref:hypothetical protein n=1 Tax=Streptomyces sp. NPDC051642 TaxID=3154646 RepID=UPI003442D947